MVLHHQKFEFGHKCLIEKVVIQAPFRYSVNFHDEACFIYFLEGTARTSSPIGQVPVASGEAVILKCGSYFADLLKYSEANRYEILVVHLYKDILRMIYKHEMPALVKEVENKSYISYVATHDVVKKFVESLSFYFDNPELVNDELLELKFRELILLLLRTQNTSSIVSLFTDLFAPRNVSIKEVVNNHIFSELSVEDLANLANLSVSTFTRSFQTLFNDTPANYIKRKRLERAKDLLAMSDLSVSEIALQTCFTDVAHFSRSFKTAYHCSPSAYRLSLKGI
ncbi:helix-turn-helix domain-containing protein [Niastella populi]|uniref:HTH araC/xylS-type domain-containing protein n=1 Tax=Niastella populi TaxID=550983 RepID=A0A1V9GD91_9BACT|nr:AraC family transcriptional regulator [Niastella populi]OQP68639.1 hypothetical protein A4R26_02255 [Niastella populi]